ncbi:MAG TPA: hypothetical protein VK203_23585 [Nostocaceae cyanobacterium]|nr:hypothetical protein [Nostocaceae cyanobacterium]
MGRWGDGEMGGQVKGRISLYFFHRVPASPRPRVSFLLPPAFCLLPND